MTSTDSRSTFVGEIVASGHTLAVAHLLASDQTLLRLAARDDALGAGAIVLARTGDNAAEVERVLAPAGSALAAVYQVAAAHGLDPLFPSAIGDELAALVAEPGIEARDLKDLTALPFCTIDSAQTRDLDQALCIERTASGYRVWYALADAAAFVRPGGALFDEALNRGASYYLPGLVIPMLPPALSEGLISLNPNVDRRALVFELTLDESARCVETNLHRARIHSRAKLSFETVQAFLDAPSQHPIEPTDLAQSLKNLRAVGEQRARDRTERNVVRYRRTDVQTRIGDDPMRFVVIDDLRNDVERYNEELSLLCNVEGARFLRAGDSESDHVQPIYRVHPAPERDRIARFEATLAQLVSAHGLDPELWGYPNASGDSLAQYLAALPREGAQGRIAAAIHRQAIIMNARSAFSQRAGGHYGVGAEVYARFSAPMREIVGVFLHKEALEKLAGHASPHAAQADDALRERIVERANEAKRLQGMITNAANRLAIDQVFGERQARQPDTPFAATVMGMTADRVYLRLDDPAIEVKAYLRDLARGSSEKLAIDVAGVALRSRTSERVLCRLGDEVHVAVDGRDERRNRWMLRLVTRPA